MAHPSTLYRFRIELSDIDRGVYEKLDFRLAMHPSESIPYLVTRVIAYALNFQDGLDFSAGGLSEPDEPCLKMIDPNQGISLWIEIGNPSAKKLHRAAKSSKVVRVYTYKDPEVLIKDLVANQVYHAERIEISSLPQKFLDRIGDTLVRDNQWNVLFSDGTLSISGSNFSETGEVSRHFVPTR